MRRRWVLGAAAAMGAGVPLGLWAQPNPDKHRATLATTGWAHMPHLPLVLAWQLGFFRAEGLQVDPLDITDTGPSAAQVQAGDPPLVWVAPFEQVLNWRAQGVPVTAFAQVTRTPQVVLGVSTRLTPADLGASSWSDRPVGVLSLHSPGHQVARLWLAQAGVPALGVPFQELGTVQAAVTALRSGRVDAVCVPDPAATALEQEGALRVLLDTRVPAQHDRLYGGVVPGHCLVAHADVLRQHAPACSALVHGLVHALHWLRTAGPADLVRAVPETHFHGDRAVYLAAFNKTRHALSTDGLIPVQAPANARRAWLLSAAGAAGAAAVPDASVAYTNAWVREAKARFRV